MRPLHSTERGDWLLSRIGEWATSGGVAGAGFQAYARILHPLQAWQEDQAVTDEWGIHPTVAHSRWGWAEVARRNGREMHPLVQWNSLTDFEQRLEFDDGWQVGQSEEGQLASELLAALTEHLDRATTTPGEITAGLWNGWGELYPGTASVMLVISDTVDPDERDREKAQAQAEWLAEKESRISPDVRSILDAGTLFEWPGREFLLLDTSLAELSDPEWPDAGGIAGLMPQMLWPADHAWVVASEIDWDFTIVAGSRQLVDAVLADERFETFEVQATSDLSWDGDTVNPRPQGRMDA